MQDILKYEEKKPLSFALMKKFAPPWCTVRLYDGLTKYSSLKAAAGSKPCMIVLYELHERDETRRSLQFGPAWIQTAVLELVRLPGRLRSERHALEGHPQGPDGRPRQR